MNDKKDPQSDVPVSGSVEGSASPAWVYSGSHTSAGCVDYFVTDQRKGGIVAVVSAPTSDKAAQALAEKRAILFAAAPELLDALKNLVAACDYRRYSDSFTVAAHEAITNATASGEQPERSRRSSRRGQKAGLPRS